MNMQHSIDKQQYSFYMDVFKVGFVRICDGRRHHNLLDLVQINLCIKLDSVDGLCFLVVKVGHNAAVDDLMDEITRNLR